MRTLLITMSTVLVLAAAPALAQQPQEPAKSTTTETPKATTGSSTSTSATELTADHCKAMMDKAKAGTTTAADKAEWSKHKEACAAMSKKSDTEQKK